MNCLCCGKAIRGNTEQKWHKSCVRLFFGSDRIPLIDINDNVLEELAQKSAALGRTVPGVQKKLSVHLLSGGDNSRLTLVDYPSGYILKPQVAEFEALPEAEQLVMCMANRVGISTVPHALIMIDGKFAYITKRIDRKFENGNVLKFAMEDFCQLDLRLTQDKYKGSYERCAKIIERYSASKGLDMTELFLRLVFSFVVGNSDMHLKNFSLIETEANRYVLSAAYDLLPVNIVMPEDMEQFALAMNGKKKNIRRKDFLIFAKECNLPPKSAEKMIERIISMEDTLITLCNDSYLPQHMKTSLVTLIKERTEALT